MVEPFEPSVGYLIKDDVVQEVRPDPTKILYPNDGERTLYETYIYPQKAPVCLSRPVKIEGVGIPNPHLKEEIHSVQLVVQLFVRYILIVHEGLQQVETKD